MEIRLRKHLKIVRSKVVEQIILTYDRIPKEDVGLVNDQRDACKLEVAESRENYGTQKRAPLNKDQPIFQVDQKRKTVGVQSKVFF